jgi:hypothetical protein
MESEEREQLICTEKALAFRGAARVPLESVSFEEPGKDNNRPICGKNVERLRNIFFKQGCLRTELRNYIKVLVDENCLNLALAQAGLQPEALTEFPHPVLQIFFLLFWSLGSWPFLHSANHIIELLSFHKPKFSVPLVESLQIRIDGIDS